MKATIEYAKSQKMDEYDDDNEYYKDLMQKFIQTISPCINIEREYSDFFIHYGIAGVFALCKRRDCMEYYSVGDSYDICELFSVIQPFLSKDEEPNDFTPIYEIFQESVFTKIKVTTR